jgi:hypothetical protein
LQSTEFIIGLVTYAGEDTKIMKNSVRAKAKLSSIEKTTGLLV